MLNDADKTELQSVGSAVAVHRATVAAAAAKPGVAAAPAPAQDRLPLVAEADFGSSGSDSEGNVTFT